MSKDEWAALLRATAAKANPVMGGILRSIAEKKAEESEANGEWIGVAPGRDPGEEG